MTAHVPTFDRETVQKELPHSQWRAICTLGGVAALLTVMTALAEILITFLPGGYTTAETVTGMMEHSRGRGPFARHLPPHYSGGDCRRRFSRISS